MRVRRSFVAIAGILAMFGGVRSDAATCTATSCPPVAVIFGGTTLSLCSPACTYSTDAFWQGPTDVAQGLYLPTQGPPARGRFDLGGGMASCVSTLGVCSLGASGTLGPSAAGVGAYCSSVGFELDAHVEAGARSFLLHLSWQGGVLLGTVTVSSPGGYEGAQVFGMLGARSLQTGGNCTASSPLTHEVAEGSLLIA